MPTPKSLTLKKTEPKKKTSKKPIVKTATKRRLPNVWELSRKCILILWDQHWLFLGIALVYGIVDLLVAQGLPTIASTSTSTNPITKALHGSLGSSLSSYTNLLSTIGGSSANGSTFGYAMIITVIVSLAIIWAIRNSSNKVKITIRSAFYLGMYPLVPFLAILLVIGLELIPLIVGVSVYALAVHGLVAITILEKLLFLLLAVMLAGLTMFWISSSIFALYIVTLPEMTPMKALRTAKGLVQKRRLPILLRILFLPLALLLISGAIMLPIIIVVPAAASWVFLSLALLMLIIAHAYFYNFYRELIV